MPAITKTTKVSCDCLLAVDAVRLAQTASAPMMSIPACYNLLEARQARLTYRVSMPLNPSGPSLPRALTAAAADLIVCLWCCATDGQPRYKYQERVRKKADREKLVGRDCQDCAGWYAALKTLGIGGMADTRPACGHAVGGECLCVEAA